MSLVITKLLGAMELSSSFVDVWFDELLHVAGAVESFRDAESTGGIFLYQ
jgi:hypothetical protein